LDSAGVDGSFLDWLCFRLFVFREDKDATRATATCPERAAATDRQRLNCSAQEYATRHRDFRFAYEPADLGTASTSSAVVFNKRRG
jgi:hypothetical protein